MKHNLILSFCSSVCALLIFGSMSARAQDCGDLMVDAIQFCEGATQELQFPDLGVDTMEWVGVEWWDPSGVPSDSSGTDVLLELGEAGWWTFAFYGAAGDTCMDSLYATSLQQPLASFVFVDGVCGNAGVSFSNTSTGGVGTEYNWDFGDGTSGSSLTSPTHAYAAPGGGVQNFQVTLTATNGDGTCPSDSTQTISVLQVPTPNFNDAPPLCQSDENWPFYELVLPPYPPATSWHLDWGNGTDTTFSAPNFANPPHTLYETFGLFDIVLTVVGANGCENVITHEVFVGSNPTIGTANPGNTVGLCVPAELIFPITEFVNNVEGTTYTIDFGDGSSVVYDHPPPSEVAHAYVSHSCGEVTPEGSNNALRFKVTASNECGTSISTHDPIRLHRTPDPELSGPQVVCPGTYNYNVQGNGLVVTAADCAESDVYWSVETIEGPGSAFANPGVGTTSSINFSQAGLYEVSVYDYHLYCEDGQDTLPVCVIPPPLASAVPSISSGCAPLDVAFLSTTAEPVHCGSYSYAWNVSGGSYGFADGTNANSPSPTITFYNQGTYTITQTVTAPGTNCSQSIATHTVEVYTQPFIEISSGGMLCENDVWDLSVLSSYTGGDPNTSFYWIIEGEDVYTPIGQPLEILLDDSGFWTAYAYLTNACGTASDNALMTVNESPDLEFVIPPSACAGETQVAEVSGADNYQWFPSPDALDPGNEVASYELFNDVTVTVTGTNSYPSISCTTEATINLVVDPLPVVNLSPLGIACAGSPFSPNPSVASGTPAYEYAWTYGASSASVEEPTFEAQDGISVVSLVVTDSQGCQGSDSELINVLPLPSVDAGTLDGFCDQNIDTLLTSATPIGGYWSGSGISSSGVLNPANLGVGTWIATYTFVDANGCQNSDDLAIEVFAPLFAEAGPDIAVCDVDTTLQFLDFTPATQGSWSGPGLVVDPSTGMVDVGSLLPGLYAYSYNYGTGTCATSDQRTLTIYENPVAELTVDDMTPCDGDEVVATASATGGAGGYAYALAGAGWELINANQAALTVAWGEDASIAAQVTDLNGCIGNDSLSVEVLALPNLIVLDTLVACNQAVLEQLPDPNPAGGSWSGAGVVDANGTFDPSLPGLGEIPLLYSYTDAAGCSNTMATIAEVVAPVFADAGSGATICDVDTNVVLLDFSPAGGTWSGEGLSETGVWQAGPLAPGDYPVTYAFGEGSCATSSSQILSILPRPDLSIEGPAESCIGDSIYFTATASGGGAPYFIQWLNPMAPPGSTAAFLPSAAGEFTVEVMVTDANGCSEFGYMTTVVNPLPEVDAGPDVLMCNQSILEQLNGATPGPVNGSTNYYFGVGPGAGAVSPTGSFEPSVAGVGEFFVGYVFESPVTGCIGFDTLVVTVTNPEVVEAGWDTIACANDPLLQLEGFLPSSGGTWFTSVPEDVPALVDNESGVINPQLLTPGEHQFYYSFGVSTCYAKDSILVNISPLPVLSVLEDDLFCLNDSLVPLADATPLGGTWEGPGVVGGNFNALIGAGDYEVFYAFTSPETSCSDTLAHTVTVQPLPLVFAGPDLVLCDQPIPEVLSGFAPLDGFGGSAFFYGLGDAMNAVTPEGTFDPSISGLGQFQVVYSFTSFTSNCTNRDTLTITVNAPSLANAGLDTIACANAPFLEFEGFSPATGGTWVGLGDASLGLTNAASGVVNPQLLDPGSYAFAYQLGTGTCFSSDTLFLTVDALPEIGIGAADVFCLNDSTVPLVGVTPDTGTWEGDGVTGFNFNTLIGPGDYDVFYWYTSDLTSCSDTVQHQVTVNPLPMVDAGLDVLMCNQPIEEQLAGAIPGPVNGVENYFYGLNGAQTAVSALGAFDPFESGVGTFPVVYAYTSPATGCIGRDTLLVTVTDPVIADAGLDSVVCINAPFLELEAFDPPFGGTWFASVSDDVPALADASLGIINPQLLSPGEHQFYFEYGASTCYSKDSLIVTVNPLPEVSVLADDVFCLNDTLMPLSAASPLDGTWEGPGVEGSEFNTLVGAGGYDVFYWYTSPLTACSDTADHHVTVQPLPLVFAGSDLTLCNQPIEEVLTGYAPLDGFGGTAFFYGLGGASDAVTADGIFNPVAAGVGTFQIVYSFTSSITNCTNRDTLEITVVDPVVAFAGLDTIACANAPFIELQGYQPLSGGMWFGADLASEAGLVDPENGVINPQLLEPGTYAFGIEIGTGTCYSSDTLSLVIDPLPFISLPLADEFCLNDTTMLLAEVNPSSGTWEGVGVDGYEFNTLVGAGSYDLFYWYTNGSTGCSDTVSHVVTVNPLPVVNAGLDLVLCDQPIGEQLLDFTPGLNQGGTGGFYGLDEAAGATTSAGWFEPSVTGVGTFDVVYAFTSASTGCSHTDTLEVEVVPPVVAFAGLDTTVCANAPLVQLDGYTPAAAVNWFSTSVSADAAVVSASGGVVNPQLLGTGGFTFSMEYGSGTCYSRDSMVMTVLALPDMGLGDPDAWCGNLGIQALAEPFPEGGTWFGAGVTDDLSGSFDTELTPAVYAPSYTFTDEVTGCADTLIHEVTIHPVPVAAFDADTLGCTNGDLPLDQQSTGANAAFWWLGDGDVSFQWEPDHTYEEAGVYTIQMMASNAFGCKDTTDQDVTITTPPQAAAMLDPNAGCAPLEVTFQNTSDAPYSEFFWVIGEDETTDFEPAPMTFLQGDSVVQVPVSLTVTNVCAASVYEDSVTVFPSPTLSFALFQDTACSPYALEVLNTSAGLPDELIWDMGNGVSYTSQQPPSTWYSVGEEAEDFIISLIGINECGTDTAEASFHVLPNTVSAFFESSVQSGCAPLGIEFTDLSQNTTAITFDFGNGLISSDSLTASTYTAPGSYDVQQFVTNGCAFDTIGMTIQVFEEPEFTLATNAPSYCVGEPVNFTVQAATSGSADWAFGNGASGVGYFAATVYEEPGAYWAVAEVGTALFQCTAEDSILVQVNPAPELNLTAPDPGCSPFEVTFGNTSVNAPYVTWNYNDGTTPEVAWAPTHGFENNTSNPISYFIEVHAESFDFCEADTILTVSVLPTPLANVLLGTTSSCEIPVDLDITNGSLGAVSSTWYFDGQLVGSNEVPTVTVTEEGVHYLVLETVNAWGCTDADTAAFTVLEQPLAAVDVYPVVGCQILPVTFNDLSVGAISSNLELTSPSGLLYDGPVDGTAFFNLEEPGLYSAQFTATSPDGCVDGLEVPQLIQVHPTPVANFISTPFIGSITDIDPLNDTWEFESTSLGATIWNWNFGDGGVAGGPSVSHAYAGAGGFWVTLTVANDFGCFDDAKDWVMLEQLLQVFVPNAFTPPSVQSIATGTGSRGLNDAFRPVFSDIDLVAEYEFTIVNRWGDVVFHSFDPKEYWVGDAVRDGTHYAEDDVYVWTLYYQPTYEDIGVNKVGHVTLVRD